MSSALDHLSSAVSSKLSKDMMLEVALARKIQVQIWAIFDLWYKYGARRRFFQC